MSSPPIGFTGFFAGLVVVGALAGDLSAAPSGTLSASALAPCAGAAPGNQCATISWTAKEVAPQTANIWVKVNGGAPVLFACGWQGGSQQYASIAQGNTYEFKLYHAPACNSTPAQVLANLATLTVRPTPAIANVKVVNIQGGLATVQWTTDRPADTQVDYAISYPPYATFYNNSSLTTWHSAQLIHLTQNFTYHFRVRSRDAAGNIAETADMTFQTPDTLPAVISNLRVTYVSDNMAEIAWDTNEPAQSNLVFSASPAGLPPFPPTFPGEMLTSHKRIIQGLQPNKTYSCKVRVKDQGNFITDSPTLSFTTTAPPPPPSYEVLMQNGDVSKKINVLIMAEGYTLADMAEFDMDARGAMEAIFKFSPLKERRTDFNVYKINTISNRADNTYFSGSYGPPFLGIARQDRLAAAKNIVPGRDDASVILFKNDFGRALAKYGDVTYVYWFPGNSVDALVAHEVGHVLGFLGDEYSDGAGHYMGSEPFNANLTLNTNTVDPNHKWFPLMGGPRNVGVFEGGLSFETGIYRPTESGCLMRQTTGGPTHCPVCFRQLTRKMDELTDAAPPTVTITAPLGNPWITAHTVQVTAAASDNIGVDRVQFTVNGQNTVTDFSAPYSAQLTLPQEGPLTLTAVAFDRLGNPSSPSHAAIRADWSPPVAQPGPDRTVTDNNGDGREVVTLDGSGSSDPTPGGSVKNFTWRRIDGAILATTARVDVSLPIGTHDFTLIVEDQVGWLVSKTVRITVRTPPPVVKLPIPSAVADKAPTLAPKVKDGNPASWSKWAFSGSSGYIILDLGAAKPIREIRYFPAGPTRIQTTDIQYANNAANNSWATFPGLGGINTRANKDQWNVLGGLNQTARYVRFNITATNATYDVGAFSEIEIWGHQEALAPMAGAPEPPAKSRQRFLSPALEDGVNDIAFFGTEAEELLIVDINGRSVYEMTVADSGNAFMTWNGRDSQDKLVPSGIYLARIKEKTGGYTYQTIAVVK